MSTKSLLTLTLVAVNAAFLIGAASAQTSPSPEPMATPPVANPPPPADSTPPPPPGHHPHPNFMEMINKLDLTDAQKTQIETINNSTADNKEKHSQIKALLTQDQQAQLKTLMSQWKAAHPPGGAPPPPAN